MHLHNVSAYAPPGYALARTEYVGDCTRHVFAKAGAPDIACDCPQTSREAEVAALSAFQSLHTPQAPVAVAEPVAPAKPSRKRV